MVCAAKGYKCIIVMPQIPSFNERYIICRQFGAEVHLLAPAKGVAGMQAHVKELLDANPDYICTEQFNNPSNPEIHVKTTGPEILEQAGTVDYFIAGVGTGGTVTGCGKFLKGQNAETKVVAVEPAESRVNTGAAHTPHTIMGIGAGVVSHRPLTVATPLSADLTALAARALRCRRSSKRRILAPR